MTLIDTWKPGDSRAGHAAHHNALADAINQIGWNVKNYGAKGDGVTNDQPACQAAIDACQIAGGGTVYFPAGTYNLWVPKKTSAALSNGNYLLISSSNVTLAGAGIGTTKLVGKATNGGTVSANYQVFAGAVWRGSVIFIAGGATTGEIRRNVTVRDMEIDGGAGYTGNFVFPANVGTGDGWDITHHAIWDENDKYFTDLVFERLWCHSFRGEIIVGPGQGSGRITGRHLKLGDTNANCFNIDGTVLLFEDSECYTAYHAIEATAYIPVPAFETQELMIYRRNYLHDCQVGLSLAWTGTAMPPGAIIEDNLIRNIIQFGIYVVNLYNVQIRRNTLIDATTDTTYGMIRVDTLQPNHGAGQWVPMTDLQICDNVMLVESINGGYGLILTDTNTQSYKNVVITGNLAALSAKGVAAGLHFGVGFDFISSAAWPSDIVIADNVERGVLFPQDNGGVTGLRGNIWHVSAVPASAMGANGDFALRRDTPTIANQRLYVKSAGSWTGIL